MKTEELKMILYLKFMDVLPESKFKVIHAEEYANDVIEEYDSLHHTITESEIEEMAINYLKKEYPEDYAENDDLLWSQVNDETVKDFTAGFKVALQLINK